MEKSGYLPPSVRKRKEQTTFWRFETLKNCRKKTGKLEQGGGEPMNLPLRMGLLCVYRYIPPVKGSGWKIPCLESRLMPGEVKGKKLHNITEMTHSSWLNTRTSSVQQAYKQLQPECNVTWLWVRRIRQLRPVFVQSMNPNLFTTPICVNKI